MVNSTCMDFKKIEAMKEDFKKRELNVLKNSVLKNGLNASVMNNDVFNSTLHLFSENIETGKVTFQKQSGRCWIFAALNTFSH